mgnify:CR=1 FL=1
MMETRQLVAYALIAGLIIVTTVIWAYFARKRWVKEQRRYMWRSKEPRP